MGKLTSPGLLPAHVIFAGLAASLITAGSARSETPEEFFTGKEITLVIGYNPGGSYDLYARLAASLLPQYIPGHPTIIPKNMPGVGSIKAANYLFRQAASDGTTIGVIGQALGLYQVLHNPGVQYDVSKFNWLGRFAPSVENTIVWYKSPIKTIQDAMRKETLLAGTSAGSTTDLMPRVMNRIAGTKFKVVKGYPGSAGSALAMERGEVDGTLSTVAELLFGKPEWVREKKISVLVEYAQHRDPHFPDAPAMVEFGRTATDKQLLSLFGSTAEIGRALMAPPGLPHDRLAALRSAFSAMVADPSFKDEVRKRNMESGPMSGEELQGKIRQSLDVSSDVTARAIELSKE